MTDEMVTTGVDDLLAYCKGKDKVSLQDAAAVLDIPVDTMQAWVDFLVEEKILGIEYKFTKPFIYLNKETGEKAKVIEQTGMSFEEVKKSWEQHAKEQKIPEEKFSELWKSHVTQALDRQREYFMDQAMQRHASQPEQLWEAYKKKLLAKG